MKSSEEQLRHRGRCAVCEVIELNELSLNELYDCLIQEEATDRSAAAIALTSRFQVENQENRNEIVTHVLSALEKEKSLYTKIELCNLLELGDHNTARQMTAYLGVIGSNQYKTPPERVSMKVSYPLPRDIIARSLGRMTIKILPVLIEVIKRQELRSCYEALDAIGFMVFYHREQAQDLGLGEIIALSKKYPMDDLLSFKTAMCLSAYTQKQSKDMLEHLMKTATHRTVLQEAQRSIRLHESTRHCL